MAQVPRPSALAVEECQRAEGELARAEGRFDEAVLRLQRAAAQMERERRDGGGAYAGMLGLLANAQHDAGDLRGSWQTRQKLHRIDQQYGRTASLNHLRSRAREAQLLLVWGEVPAAREIVMSIAARFGDTRESPPTWYDQVRGELLLRQDDAPQAEASLRAAVARARANGSVGYALPAEVSLARVLIALRRADEAQALIDGWPALPASGFGIDRELIVAGLRAEVLLVRGSAGAARELDAALASDGPPTAARAEALRIAARAALTDGDPARALSRARAAVAVAERVARDPARSAEAGAALLELARAEKASGGDPARTAQRAAAALQTSLGAAHALTREALALASPPPP